MLLLGLAFTGKAQRSYEIGVYAEAKINLFGFDYNGFFKRTGGVGTVQDKSGLGLTFLTRMNKLKYGAGISYNSDFIYYGLRGRYFYGYLSSAVLHNIKLSGIASKEFKHRFYLSLFGDVCYFTYQNIHGNPDRFAPRGSPYLYTSKNPGLYALALSVRFGKQFKIFHRNLLGVHLGLQSPYLFLNWKPIYFKGINVCGLVVGLNYSFNWGKSEQ